MTISAIGNLMVYHKGVYQIMSKISVASYAHSTSPLPTPIKGKSPDFRPVPSTRKYISVAQKFWMSQAGAFAWVIFSIILSLPWVRDLSGVIGFVPALLVIAFIAYVPGYLVAFLAISLLVDRQPPFKVSEPDLAITILIAARNEASNIGLTLQYIANQDYKGPISVVLVANGSTDGTAEVALTKARELNLNLLCLRKERPGKNFALNAGLAKIRTPYFITLDADTLLHRLAVKHIVARLLSSPPDVGAVAGYVLVRNSRDNFLTRLQEWDYFLGIASIKRTQGLYQGTLVAQGAFSLYKTEAGRYRRRYCAYLEVTGSRLQSLLRAHGGGLYGCPQSRPALCPAKEPLGKRNDRGCEKRPAMASAELKVFSQLNLRVRKNSLGFLAYVLAYQLISSPISLWGYLQELLQTHRVWR